MDAWRLTGGRTDSWAGLMLVGPDGRILLAQRAPWLDAPLVWSVPAGKLEPGENVYDAAVREFREEMGRVPAFRKSAVHKEGRFTTILAEMERSAAKRWSPVLNPENVDWGWFHIEDLPRPIHPGVVKALLAFLR